MLYGIGVMCIVYAVNVHVVYGMYVRYGLCVYTFVCHVYVWGVVVYSVYVWQ